MLFANILFPVDFSERSIDRQTGTAMQRGVFPNAEWTLVPGLFVRIKAPVGKPRQRLLVEARAVSADQRGDCGNPVPAAVRQYEASAEAAARP